MNDLAVRELRILVAVERARSFTAAAQALGLTQSAVSHAVNSCERKIGAVLFDRGRHGARPTPAGERAAAHSRRILRLLDALPDEARGASTKVLTGPLRIAAFRSAAVQLLPTALTRLAAAHPGLAPEVRIVPEVGRGTAGEVLDGRADLGIATLSGSFELPAGAVAGELFQEEYSLVHPSGSTDPRALPLIDWAENCSSYTRAWWQAQDWLPAARLDAGEDSVVLSMVARGMGMAIMPRLALLDAPASVTVTDLGTDRPTRTVGYVTTPELARTLGVRALIRELRAVAAVGGPA
ncbi:LysR family transcriptional regulator [Kitasatospora sp. NBC_01266]|uniref:LysR family transcriptional regulator n=1 Tax=Kitasatospora sp. NBC_01266 TaxID=2903572 RepID=UPI002E33DC4A|nr:LysR family transcriptional regulator [Kitasatospora sp. NBC_01266]